MVRCISLYMHAYLGWWGTGLRWPKRLPTPGNRRLSAALHGLNSIIRRMIEDQRKHGSVDDPHLLAWLVGAEDEEGKSLGDVELRDEAVTLSMAGHETTAFALSMTLWLLADYPAVEARLHDEVSRVVGDRPATFEDVRALEYTNRVVTEAMRLYPPAWAIGREPLEDLVIRGHRVPQGSTIFMSQWVVHRDGRWYDRPLEFWPDRWAAPNLRERPRFAYFPFGGGQRVCIGKRFAQLEIALVLATLSQRVRLTRVPS